MNDSELLRDFVQRNSQEAFRQLVARHMKMVYGTCQRDLRDATLAEDATQTVFVLLARKAVHLPSAVSVSGWLFQTSRLVSRNLLRTEERRRRHEREAALGMERQRMDDREVGWQHVEPWINDALSMLSTADREVVLLRYFDDLSPVELARQLGTNDATARKRVSRAVDRLRRCLAKKEVPITAVALAALLAAHPSRAAVPMSVDALTQHALQSMTATAASGAALTASPCHRLMEQGARIVMEVSRQKAMVVAAVAIAGLGVIAVPVSMWRMHHGGGASGGIATFTDATVMPDAQDVAPAVASQGPASARTEIDQDYRTRINRVVSGDLSGITQNCAPDFTLSGPSGQSKSLAQWQRESSGFLSKFAKLNGSLTLRSAQIDGDHASVTLQWHLEGVGSAAQTPSYVEEDALVDSWERRNGTWVLVNTRLVSEDSTTNGVTTHF